MIRTIVWFTYFWLYMIVSLPLALFVKTKPEASRQQIAANSATKWASRLLKLAGARVTISGLENIPSDKPVLFVSNHQGAFDIPLLLAHLGRPFGFIAKEELAKLPFVNFWMRCLRCVFITRGNPREAIKAINDGIALLKGGHSLMVFPEGTRSKTGDLLPFKPGSLRLATKSGVHVIPITINGSKNLMRPDSMIIQPASLHITVHPAIMPEIVSSIETADLTEQIVATIESALS